MKDNKVDSGIAQARKGGILDIAFGKKDKQMATASMDGKARYYNLDGQIKLEHTMEGHKAPITQVSVIEVTANWPLSYELQVLIIILYYLPS